MNDLLTLDEIAEMFHVSKRTAYKYLLRWQVPVVRYNRFIRVLREDLNIALNNNKHSW